MNRGTQGSRWSMVANWKVGENCWLRYRSSIGWSTYSSGWRSGHDDTKSYSS